MEKLTDRELLPTEKVEKRKGFLWIRVGLIAAISEIKRPQQALGPISNDNFAKKLDKIHGD